MELRKWSRYGTVRYIPWPGLECLSDGPVAGTAVLIPDLKNEALSGAKKIYEALGESHSMENQEKKHCYTEAKMVMGSVGVG